LEGDDDDSQLFDFFVESLEYMSGRLTEGLSRLVRLSVGEPYNEFSQPNPRAVMGSAPQHCTGLCR
jgi:hypothetical protein